MGDSVKPVISPISGVLYRRPSPEDPPFVEVGSQVKKGQTLCLLETMKVFTKVKAPFDGEVVEILVENEDTISKSQTLMRMRA